MKKIIPAVVLFSLVLINFSRAQEAPGEIFGRVTTSDGEPAGYVSIAIKETSVRTITKENGDYNFKRIKPGAYTIRVSAVGLEPQEKQVELTAGQKLVANFVLSENLQRLQEVVISAAGKRYKADNISPGLRLDEPLLEIAQNIQVVSSATLADQQVISMSDNLIRNVSGATRLEHWGDLYANINMRGTQIQAFRNGFNVVNSYWGPLTEDMSFVDHIEFVKGPAGFMLSNGDPTGLYNVVTKKPTGQTRGEASFTLGSYDLYRGTLDLDGKITNNGRLLYRINLAGQNKNSHRAYEYNNRFSIAPVVSYQIDEKTKLTAEYSLQSANMSDVGSYYIFDADGYATKPTNFTLLSPGLQPTRIKDHSTFVTLNHQLSDDWKFTASASYFDYGQTGSSMWPDSVGEGGNLIRSVGIWDAKSTMTMAQVFLNGNFKTGAVNHRILSGLDVGTKNYEADWGQSHPLDTRGAEFNTNDPHYGTPNNGFPRFDRSLSLGARAIAAGGLMDQRYSGFYLQDELGFLENRIRLTLAGRYTVVSQSSWGGAPQKAKHVTPRLGLSVSLDKQTSVYAMYDQAFIPQNGKLADGGDIRPITGNNTEFGIKKDWFNGSWNTTVSLYRILKNNELTDDPLSPPSSGLSVVLGQKRAQGLEFDIRGELARGFDLIANYAYTKAEVTEVTPGVTTIKVGDVVPGFSKHTINSWLKYKFPEGALKGVGISGGFSYLVDRATDSWSDTDVRLPDYFKLDGGLSWQRNQLTINANAYNILNEYLYSGSYYSYLKAFYWQTETPRNFRLSVGYKF